MLVIQKINIFYVYINYFNRILINNFKVMILFDIFTYNNNKNNNNINTKSKISNKISFIIILNYLLKVNIKVECEYKRLIEFNTTVEIFNFITTNRFIIKLKI